MKRRSFIPLTLLGASGLGAAPAVAQTADQSEAYLATIVLFAGKAPPSGWAFCEGQLLRIPQNTALFSVLGSKFGGDPRYSFALPDLRSAVPGGASSGLHYMICVRGSYPVQSGSVSANPPTLLSAAGLGAAPVVAQGLAHGYIGTIVLWAGNAPPDYAWLFCEGQQLSLQDYTALFEVMGRRDPEQAYSFALPDLRDALPRGVSGLHYMICVWGVYPSTTGLARSVAVPLSEGVQTMRPTT
jgi:microcystin-dependent protein